MPKILAVDDSLAVRQIVSFALREAGHEVIEAEDGEEALVKAVSSTIDLILTDLDMPGMDGIELVRRLRQLPAYEGTPILMLTTESGADKRLEGKRAGATDWFVKPFNPEKLLAAIARMTESTE